MNQKTNETVSTRKQAMAWWDKLSFATQQEITELTRLAKDLPLLGMHLTGREIEQIWRKETQYDKERAFVAQMFNSRPNQKQFKIGDTVKCLTNVDFMYGDKHFAGNKYVVTEETQAYFNVMHKNYVLVDNSKQFKQFDEGLFKAYIDKLPKNSLYLCKQIIDEKLKE